MAQFTNELMFVVKTLVLSNGRTRACFINPEIPLTPLKKQGGFIVERVRQGEWAIY